MTTRELIEKLEEFEDKGMKVIILDQEFGPLDIKNVELVSYSSESDSDYILITT